MKSRHLLATAFAALAIASAAIRYAPAQTPAQTPPPTRIAVINLAQVFDKLDEQSANSADLDKLTKQLNDEQSSRKDQLTKLSNDLSSPTYPFKAGSPEYKKAQDDLLQKSMELEAFSNMAQQKITLETRDRMIRLYTHIQDAVNTYCKANGIALLLVQDDANLSTAKTPQDLLGRIMNRKVIYADPGFDITQKLVAQMNADYRMGAGK
ncbi:MAG TPA: OmpH family outer membrane protein [Phycisphaerae bacterium]|nr:OmpH family outer membrane protein [Phycisphaerae bacterium]